ncbi:uncharacterized protein TORIP [Chironomus tepperi]|uniref:uncharacterized protein TORIP n=1 Tax=Chironomus tepperi TaxID=113505 RepID=UPI00391F3576
MSGDSPPQRSLRSSTKDIKRRKSIHENDPNIRDKSPLLQHQREYSKSPVRNDNLYPDLKHLLNDSNRTNDDNVEEENSEQSVQSDINTSERPPKTYFISVALFSMLIVVVAVLILSSSRVNDEKSLPPREQVNCSQFIDLKAKYPQQNVKIFKSLKASIEGVFNRKSRPPVFLFFSTDKQILQELMLDVVKLTQTCIRHSYEPINLTDSDLNQEKFLIDYTKIIGEYKSELEKRTILVINNLDELSPNIVPSLHSFTDTYNPLVEKSIIFLSIRVPQKPINPADYIFTHLQHKWNVLASNIKDPLIARIIDQAFFLEPSY